MARRDFRRPLSALRVPAGFGRMAKACLLAVVLFTLVTHGTSASIGWCRSDPVVTIEDAPADVFVSIPTSDVLEVTGPTQFVITTPVGVNKAVLLTGPGFRYGEIVTFQESHALKKNSKGIQLRIAVYLPAVDGATPVLVEFAPRVVGILAPASAKGSTNQWITFETNL